MQNFWPKIIGISIKKENSHAWALTGIWRLSPSTCGLIVRGKCPYTPLPLVPPLLVIVILPSIWGVSPSSCILWVDCEGQMPPCPLPPTGAATACDCDLTWYLRGESILLYSVGWLSSWYMMMFLPAVPTTAIGNTWDAAKENSALSYHVVAPCYESCCFFF